MKIQFAILLIAMLALSSGVRSEEVREGGLLAGAARRDLPISIESEELEAFTVEGQKKFLFRRNVRVVQGEMQLSTAELEAFYPKGSSEPDRLVARGDVVMVQEGKTLTCDEAVYLRSEDRLICSGRAVMESEGDRLSGDRIEFELEAEVVRAFGSVQIEVMPRSEESEDLPDGES